MNIALLCDKKEDVMRDNHGTIIINYVSLDSLSQAMQKQFIAQCKHNAEAIPFEVVAESGASTERNLDTILKEYEDILAKFKALLDRYDHR